MSELTTTYTFDGKPLEPESQEAWRIAADQFRAVYDKLDELPLGLVPEVMRERQTKVSKALFDLFTQTNHIATEIERFARAGHPKPVNAAVNDALFQGRINARKF